MQDHSLDRAVTPQELTELQQRLWPLLARQATRFTKGKSSSLPAELAQELLESICYVLGIGQQATPTHIHMLLQGDLEEIYDQELDKLKKRVVRTKRLWEAACLGAPTIQNVFLYSTLWDLQTVWQQYDPLFAAHVLPIQMDYMLFQPVSDGVRGIDYLNQWLHHLMIENNFMRKFALEDSVELLKTFCPDYRGLLINLFEPIATNAVGLALLEEDPHELDISAKKRERLQRLFAGRSILQLRQLLRTGAQQLCVALEIESEAAQAYIGNLAEQLAPRIEAACPNNLNGIFLSVDNQ